jgi:hypothetical protein
MAHAQKVELITKSNRKDDRHDARTPARLARIDPELLGPVRHRSAVTISYTLPKKWRIVAANEAKRPATALFTPLVNPVTRC